LAQFAMLRLYRLRQYLTLPARLKNDSDTDKMFANRKMKYNPTHIAHIAKAPRADAQTKALSKSAILPTHTEITTRFMITFKILKY
jgi:hypothetical protein